MEKRLTNLDRCRRAGCAELPLQGGKRFHNPDGFDADSDDLSDQANDVFRIVGAVGPSTLGRQVEGQVAYVSKPATLDEGVEHFLLILAP